MAEDKPNTLFIEFAPGFIFEMRLPSEEAAGVAYTALRAAQKDETKYARAMEIYFRFIARMLIDPDDEERMNDALMDGDLTFEQISEGVESLVGGLSAAAKKPAPAKRTRRAAR